jgi:hypothetical protein
MKIAPKKSGAKGRSKKAKASGEPAIPHRLKIIKRGGGFLCRALRGVHGCAKHPGVEISLKCSTDPGADSTTYSFQESHRREEADDQDKKRNKRGLRPAGEDAVIDLQHEERPGEHQEVHKDAEKGNERKGWDVPGRGNSKGIRHELVQIQWSRCGCGHMACSLIRRHVDYAFTAYPDET